MFPFEHPALFSLLLIKNTIINITLYLETMETVGAISEGEWSCLSGMYTTEEADFLSQLLGVSEDSLYSSEIGSNSYQFSRRNNSSILVSTSDHESHHLNNSFQVLVDKNSPRSTDYFMEDTGNDTSYPVEGDDWLNIDMRDGNAKEMNHPQAASQVQNLQPKRPVQLTARETSAKDKGHNPSHNSKKKSSSCRDAPKSKRKKSQKVSSSSNDEENNSGINEPPSSSCCSEDDSSASRQLNGGSTTSLSSKGALNLNGKPRASRGAATDPQSLYARKRRERINERLRILQNLVPNGTKVDISTMLEEAVQYVKFLQLQIKLLSSDDLWMYAPIAYNGMNIGLDLKMTSPMRL
ncbi:hypothetical protein K2173_002473 [Erythroxylum novogranatense]|uniref:BHLH domain-containing protein n=1 Tax=Erythroxylum novogranatense TaxID=1862640 RepID=A0AAV8TBP0_9ROSI|nr:hypothetical protein K2173_002473 [Erythroxylum novogranatense]